MKLPKSVTTVTSFSKIIALCLFVLLPFIGFVFGMKYQKLVDKYSQAESPVFTTPDTSTKEKVMTFSGKLMRFERPAPDIAYDYQLELDTPYIDNNNASGMPQTLKSIIVLPSTQEISLQLENHIQKNVSVQGEWRWGYAESKVFMVTDLK